jgi:hypothetical protein
MKKQMVAGVIASMFLAAGTAFAGGMELSGCSV